MTQSQLTEDEIKTIAYLARIRISDSEMPEIKQKLGSIINWVHLLDEVDVSSVNLDDVDHAMPRREDIITSSNMVEDIVSNAPDKQFNMFGVPKVIE